MTSMRAIMIAAALVLVAGCAEEIPEPIIQPVMAVKVSDAKGFMERKFPGQASAAQEVNLSFRVGGPLITRPVNVGDLVKAGEVVARIDPRDYEVSLRNSKGQLAKAKADLVRAEKDLKRNLNIKKEDPGATSEASIDRMRDNRDSARAEVQSLQATVDSASDALDYTYLKAPFDGKIVATYVENFEYVTAKQAIVRILDTRKIKVIINLPENLIATVPYVEDLKVSFESLQGIEVPATVSEIGSEATETTRTFPVTLIMDQPEGAEILPGMAGYASGRVRLPEEQAGLQVPSVAVFSDQTQKSYVWVLEAVSPAAGAKVAMGEILAQAKKREVTVGELTAVGITVKTGLEPGEWIATAGVTTLLEGQKVRIQGVDSEGKAP